ncbi:MAG: 50S ribosomal protein L20 [Candidatus Riflebacteria bacterium RBG_13_59_9]|nr:MAG: 50S ribosomal protein L20 [Candidatus Riflebacteria bacterium RBG_13_59_9]
MTRVKRSVASRARRRRVLKQASGYRGTRGRLFRAAKEAVMHAGQYAYIHRRTRKRDFRRLWIARISAACRGAGINYSCFMNGLSKAGIELNRKQLAELALFDGAAFTKLTEMAREH